MAESQPQYQYPRGRMIAARYTGSYSVYVPPRDLGREYTHADGTKLPKARTVTGLDSNNKVVTAEVYLLEAGATIPMPEHEILGQTLLIDPTMQNPPIWRGWGWCPEARHAAYTPWQLADMRFLGPDGTIRTYEFHSGRTDFVPLDPASEPTYVRFPSSEKLAASRATDLAALAQAEAEEQAYQAERRAAAETPQPVEDVPVVVEPSTTPTTKSKKATAAATPADDAAQEE